MYEVCESSISSCVFKWLINHEGIKQGCQCSLNIENGNLCGNIHFYDDILELVIINKNDNETVFYIHFQMLNMASSLEHLNMFFHYMTCHGNQFEEIKVENLCIKKILLSCSSGLTSSYFAESMQNLLKEKGFNIQVDASAYTSIDYIANDYDIILLAPQIAYRLPEVKSKYGCKVMNIDAIDFATSNFSGIMNKISL